MPRYDIVYIGSVPYDEDCAQVGDPDYEVAGKAQCNRFMELLRKIFGPEPEGAKLKVKSNPHDFGTYYEVVCALDVDNAVAVEYAYKLEDQAPATWDATTPNVPKD